MNLSALIRSWDIIAAARDALRSMFLPCPPTTHAYQGRLGVAKGLVYGGQAIHIIPMLAALYPEEYVGKAFQGSAVLGGLTYLEPILHHPQIT